MVTPVWTSRRRSCCNSLRVSSGGRIIPLSWRLALFWMALTRTNCCSGVSRRSAVWRAALRCTASKRETWRTYHMRGRNCERHDGCIGGETLAGPMHHTLEGLKRRCVRPTTRSAIYNSAKAADGPWRLRTICVRTSLRCLTSRPRAQTARTQQRTTCAGHHSTRRRMCRCGLELTWQISHGIVMRLPTVLERLTEHK